MNVTERYPKLTYFFSAYFHTDWVVLYDWKGGRPAFQVVVQDFVDRESQMIVEQATRELEHMTSQSINENDLHSIVVYQLGANVNASALGIRYQQWLGEVLIILQSSKKVAE